jgi:ABC-type nitrate/sulfonate/bicarbonate transport system substrate-binding protein
MRSADAMSLALLGQLALGCGGPPASPPPADHAGPSTPVKVRFIDLANQDVRDVPLLMALDDLAARGYVIERRYLTGGPLMADLVARGEAEIAMINNQAAWAAAVKGAPVRTISQFTGSSGLLAARPHVRTCRDLDGRRVGIPAGSGPSVLQLSLYIERRCPGAKPQTLAIPESAARSAALLSGRLDASLLPGEELFKLQRQTPDSARALMVYAEEFPDVQIDGLHVNRTWAASNPGAVRDFVRAQVLAYRRVRADPGLLFAEASKRLSMDSATARAVGKWHLRRGMWDANGGLTPANIRSTIDFFQKADGLPEGVTPEQVADLSYLTTVLEELGRDDSAPHSRSQPSR